MRGGRCRLVGMSLVLVLASCLPTPLARPAVSPGSTPQDVAAMLSPAAALGQLPLYFVENRGQLDARVGYYAHAPDAAMYFTSQGLTIALSAPATASADDAATSAEQPGRWAVAMEFEAANPATHPEGLAQTEAVVSYFRGAPASWQTGLPTYGGVRYAEVWPGIEASYDGSSGHLKYRFVVQPGANPDQARLRYRGAEQVRLTADGQLEVSTPLGGFVDQAPLVYQERDGERQPVPAGYRLLDDEAGDVLVGFALGAYDPALPLVLDPTVLIYSGFIGGKAENAGHGIAVDEWSNAYVVGWTDAQVTSFPVTVGPDLIPNGQVDAFVAKVRSDGKTLLYAGYLGGSQDDYGFAIAVDRGGSAYITGSTHSNEATFPVVEGPGSTYSGGQRDAFVAKINPTGTGLAYAGYIGGLGEDEGTAIALEPDCTLPCAAAVAGITDSSEASFPDTIGPDRSYNGDTDAFVARVRTDGRGLLFAGYIGGEEWDGAYGIAVDDDNDVYVVGHTYSDQDSFPVTIGPDLVFNGETDAFVAKVASDGSGLWYVGYIGGAGRDEGHGIAVDGGGNAYVVGSAFSNQATFPALIGPDLSHNGSWDGFVAKVNAAGTSLVYAGYIGGSTNDTARSVALRPGCAASCTAYVSGETQSTEATFPVLSGPDLTYNGDRDGFVARVAANGSGLFYLGYLGGSEEDRAFGIAVDEEGEVFVTGKTHSPNFPRRVGPDTRHNGDADAFVVKIYDGSSICQAPKPKIQAKVRPGTRTYDFTAQPRIGEGCSLRELHWFFSDGAHSTANPVMHTFGGPGTYTVQLQVSSSGGQIVFAKTKRLRVR